MYILRLESIGEDSINRLRDCENFLSAFGMNCAELRVGASGRAPWVALITGTHQKFKWSREFQPYKRDYSSANSKGSRGVVYHYELDDGIYQVHEHLSWSRNRKYYCVIENGELREIEECEIEQLLNAALESALRTPPRKESGTSSTSSLASTYRSQLEKTLPY